MKCVSYEAIRVKPYAKSKIVHTLLHIFLSNSIMFTICSYALLNMLLSVFLFTQIAQVGSTHTEDYDIT